MRGIELCSCVTVETIILDLSIEITVKDNVYTKKALLYVNKKNGGQTRKITGQPFFNRILFSHHSVSEQTIFYSILYNKAIYSQ